MPGPPHPPFLRGPLAALNGPDTTSPAGRPRGGGFVGTPAGRIVARARQVLAEARDLLAVVADEGLFGAIARGVFADVKCKEDGGRGLGGVVRREPAYVNPVLAALEGAQEKDMIKE